MELLPRTKLRKYMTVGYILLLKITLPIFKLDTIRLVSPLTDTFTNKFINIC